LRKSDGFTPNEGAKYKGVAIFDQYTVTLKLRFDPQTILSQNKKKFVNVIKTLPAFYLLLMYGID